VHHRVAAGGETRVLVNSRSAERVAEVVTQLQVTHGTARVRGFAADVSVPDDVDALTQYARDELGGVDVWINNAGSNGTCSARVRLTTARTSVRILTPDA
jgi:NAD(P)-dependent dehydrogenase (short-subunit alcohol dehydrogenase family)